MKKPVFISGAQAIERFGLQRVLDGYGSGYHEPQPADVIGVIEGDLCVSGDLLLDDTDALNSLFAIRSRQAGDFVFGEDATHAGLVVTGNLIVEGAIINSDINGGPFLFVQKGTKARVIYGGGAELRFDGPAVVRDAVVGEYNDGTLNFAGGLQAPVAISNDHDIRIAGKGTPYFRAFARPDHRPWSDIPRWGIFVHADLAARARVVDAEDAEDDIDMEKELLPRIRRGLPIVAADFRPEPYLRDKSHEKK